MSNLKEGMRVQIIGCDNELLTGTIELLNDDIAIVHANNDTRYKRTIDEIAILKESEPAEAEQPEEPKFLTEITITRDEFREKSLGVIRPTNVKKLIKDRIGEIGNPMMTVDIALTGALVVSWLEDEFFKVKSEND